MPVGCASGYGEIENLRERWPWSSVDGAIEGLEDMSGSLAGIPPLVPAVEIKIISPANQPDPKYLTGGNS